MLFRSGFKPQWRAQSHGGYKFFMNALYKYDEPAFAETPQLEVAKDAHKDTPAAPKKVEEEDDPDR